MHDFGMYVSCLSNLPFPYVPYLNMKSNAQSFEGNLPQVTSKNGAENTRSNSQRFDKTRMQYK